MTQQDLTEMTIEELYDLNFPFLLKQRSRQPLTEQEQQLHSAIIAEANRRELALRVADRRERDERLINRYHHSRSGESASAPHHTRKDIPMSTTKDFNPRDHLVKIRSKDGAVKDYYPASWRIYELNLRYPNANFASEIILLDVERNLVVVKCRLYLGASYEQSEKKTEALKSGPLSTLDKVETAAKARCARDFSISTELALEWDEESVTSEATNDPEERASTVKALQLEAKACGLVESKEQWMTFKRQVLGAGVANANLQAHQIAQLRGAIEAHKRGMPQSAA